MLKTIIILIFIAIRLLTAVSQVPQALNYQTVIKNTDGVVMTNKDINLKISIINNSDIENPVYSEKYDARTDKTGLVHVKIGQGNILNGNFNDIDWSKGNYNLQISFKEIDAEEYQILNIVPLLSVPYALYAEKAGDTGDTDMDSTNELQTISISNDTLFLTNGSFVKLPETDRDSTNELQTISISNDTIYLGKGGNVTLPKFDTSNTNELQALSISNDTVYLTNGGFVKLPTVASGDSDPNSNNELQTLSISNDTIFLSNGDYVKLPPVTAGDFDADSTNELQALTLTNDTLCISKTNSIVLPDDSISIWDIDSNRLYYNAGNVGIGTTTPESKLHVSNGNIFFDNSDNGIIFTASDNIHWKLNVNDDGSLNINNIEHTLTLQPGSEGNDVHISSLNDSEFFGNFQYMQVFSWIYGGTTREDTRVFIEFDLSGIPINASIKSAKLFLYMAKYMYAPSDGHSQLSGSNSAYIRRVTSSWTEDVNWITQPSYAVNNQVILPASDSANQDYVVEISPLIQDIVENPSTSYGLTIMLQDESPYRSLLFASSDYPDPNLRPKLEIVYIIQP